MKYFYLQFTPALELYTVSRDISNEKTIFKLELRQDWKYHLFALWLTIKCRSRTLGNKCLRGQLRPMKILTRCIYF